MSVTDGPGRYPRDRAGRQNRQADRSPGAAEEGKRRLFTVESFLLHEALREERASLEIAAGKYASFNCFMRYSTRARWSLLILYFIEISGRKRDEETRIHAAYRDPKNKISISHSCFFIDQRQPEVTFDDDGVVALIRRQTHPAS